MSGRPLRFVVFALSMALVSLTAACGGSTPTSPGGPVVTPPAPVEMVTISVNYDGVMPKYATNPVGTAGFKQPRISVGERNGVGHFLPKDSYDLVWVSGSKWRVEFKGEKGKVYAARFSDVARAFAERAAGLPYNEQGLYPGEFSSTNASIVDANAKGDPLSDFVLFKVN
jgi:hypothetical protein